MRMGRIWNEGSKVRAVMVGGSQIGRLGAEVGQKGKGAVEMEGWVKVKGRLDRVEMERVVEQVVEMGKMADKVIVGGPGNSTILLFELVPYTLAKISDFCYNSYTVDQRPTV